MTEGLGPDDKVTIPNRLDPEIRRLGRGLTMIVSMNDSTEFELMAQRGDITQGVTEPGGNNFKSTFIDDPNLDVLQSDDPPIRNRSWRNVLITRVADLNAAAVPRGDQSGISHLMIWEAGWIKVIMTRDNVNITAVTSVHLRDRVRLTAVNWP